jgi:hypothetical protein
MGDAVGVSLGVGVAVGDLLETPLGLDPVPEEQDSIAKEKRRGSNQ